MNDKEFLNYMVMNTEWSPATTQCQVEKQLELYNRVKANPLLNENGLYDLNKVGEMSVYECPSFEEVMGVNTNGTI